jgi:hypothetical protein
MAFYVLRTEYTGLNKKQEQESGASRIGASLPFNPTISRDMP